jgi:glycerate 2-kinase
MDHADQRRSIQAHGVRVLLANGVARPDGRTTAGLYSRRVRVLICPDKFRGTLTARQAAEAIGRGWGRARPADQVTLAPLADGGEGTLDVLAPTDAPDVRRIRARVHGPLGDPIDAEFGVHGITAVIESARASGLTLVGAARRDPLRASSGGTGELMRAALDEGVRRMLVGLGGSATIDGGVGMARALGVAFSTADGSALRDGGVGVLDLAGIDLRSLDRRLRAIEIVAMTDVDSPLCGPGGASVVYGPQKGASEDDVVLLDRALGHLAAIVHRDLGIDLTREPGAGAAGGLAFGLAAFCGARLRPGAAEVMRTIGFEDHVARADLVVTGEGSFDDQSLHGKVASAVLDVSAVAGVRVAILCGRANVRPGGITVRTLVDRVGEEAAKSDARRSLELIAEELARGAEVGV